MASKVIKTVFQFRRATFAEWEANKTVIPAAGEPCFITDQNVLKIGDGNTTFENLEPINGVKVAITADGKSVVMEDNIFKLAGFDAAEVGAQPRKTADGTIEWIVPSTDTLEGLQTTVATMQSDIAKLQAIVGADPGEDPLLTRVGALEGKVDVLNGDKTVEGSVKKIVADEINAFATKISDDEIVNTFTELIDYVSNHGGEAAALAADINNLYSLIGEEPIKDQIASAIATSGHIAESKTMAMFEQVKYEVSNKPVGALVDYREKEIRVMCPANTEWKLQQSGENADASKYYIGFKAYAPSDAVSFKEDTAEIIADETMYSFENNEFAGIDVYGRKYSIIWLPVAAYDESAQTWTYYGATSNADHYVGWYYSVEWYDMEGVKIGTDRIRINLTNEDCHNEIKPFYMEGVVPNAIESISVGGTLLDIVNGKVDIPLGAGLKGSDEIEIEEDGTLRIKAMSFDKLMEGDNELVFDGGGAV